MKKSTKNWMSRLNSRSASLRSPRSLRCESLEERQVLSVNPVASVGDTVTSDTMDTVSYVSEGPALSSIPAATFAVTGTTLEAERVIRDLGTIDSSLVWTAVDESTGEDFYRVQTTHDTLLTLEGIPRKDHHEIELTLYDADFQVLGSSVQVGENFRVELDALSDETFYFTIKAPAVTEVTILNAIAIDGTGVTVIGSEGDDTFQFGDAQGGTKVVLNGIEYEIDSQDVLSLTYHGNGGDDTVFLYDSAGSDTFHIQPGELVAWNDTGTWSVTADGFSTLHVYSAVGGDDTAYLYDSVASDKFKAEPGVAKMLRHGEYYNRAKGFAQVRAIAGNGGSDVALLQGSTGDDQLTAQMDETRLVGQSYDVSARGFYNTITWGMGGNDVAIITDSVLDDTVRARPHKVSMWGGDGTAPDYEIVARDFDNVTLLATQGGYDRAKLHDSALDDLFELGRQLARMSSNLEALNVIYEAIAFEWVKAYSSSGIDVVSGLEDRHDYEAVLDGEWYEK